LKWLARPADPRVRLEALRIALERGWGRPAEVRPMDDVLDAEEIPHRPLIQYSAVPTPQTAADWAQKHGGPSEPPDPAMIEQLGVPLPPAKVEGNGLAPWKPAERWTRVGERQRRVAACGQCTIPRAWP
jgi:hypothetical protein